MQRYPDTAQVIYHTLEAMNCLGEMNTDNFEKMSPRSTKWEQAKFREHLKKLEHQGRIMPSIKEVVNFVNDRADVRITLSSQVLQPKQRARVHSCQSLGVAIMQTPSIQR